jgi:hypothetical protein
MLDGGRGQDACAPGGVIGIERTGKVDATFGRGAFAGDHTVADNGEGAGRGLAAGWLEDAGFSGLGTRGGHNCTSQFHLWSSISMRA